MTVEEIASINDLQAENLSLKQEISILKEQLEWFKKQLFGKKTERFVPEPIHQLAFPWATQEQPEEKTQTVSTHTRRVSKPQEETQIKIPEGTPVENIIIDLPEEQKASLVKIGEEVSWKVAYKPGSFFIKRIVRLKYAHPHQEEQGVSIAPLPPTILPRSRVDDSLLAELMTKKFCDHMPLYRISEEWARSGVQIHRKALSQWVIHCGKVLESLVEEMQKRILQSGNIFIDEVPVPLLEKEKCRQGYIWVVCGGQEQDPPYRVYHFYPNRSHEHAHTLLKGYTRIVHSDNYGAYSSLAKKEQFLWAPCFSHIRRKFYEAEMGDPHFREWVLRKIRHLFLLERVAWHRSPEERLCIRKEKELPILDLLIEGITKRRLEGSLLPRSKLAQAIDYFHGLIPYLKTYTQHPYAQLSNNVAERAIRPLVIGRKNWMFFGSPAGAKSGSVLLSLIQTCRSLHINPRDYLEDIFRRILDHNSQKLYELLPDQWAKNNTS